MLRGRVHHVRDAGVAQHRPHRAMSPNRHRTWTVSNVLSTFVICNANDAGWLEPQFQLSSAFDDTKIPLRRLVEHFEGWPVQVTIIRGDRLL